MHEVRLKIFDIYRQLKDDYAICEWMIDVSAARNYFCGNW